MGLLDPDFGFPHTSLVPANSYLATTAMATATAPAPHDAGEWDADEMEGIFCATVEYFSMETWDFM